MKDKILNFLSKNPRVGYSLKEISKGTGIKIQIVSGILTFLMIDGCVKRKDIGNMFYFFYVSNKPKGKKDYSYFI